MVCEPGIGLGLSFKGNICMKSRGIWTYIKGT